MVRDRSERGFVDVEASAAAGGVHEVVRGLPVPEPEPLARPGGGISHGLSLPHSLPLASGIQVASVQLPEPLEGQPMSTIDAEQ